LGWVKAAAAKASLAAALAVFVLTQPVRANDMVVFEEACGACHKNEGAGIAEFAPPLAAADWAKHDRPNLRDYVPLVLLNGLSGEIVAAGKTYSDEMRTQRQRSDEEIAALADYVMAVLNTAPTGFALYTPAEIKALRANKTDHKVLLAMRASLIGRP
jgi:mono/diheme cytochrome c family protein